VDEQSHPLHAVDREVVDRLLAAGQPADEHLVEAARLLMRYQGFPGASDLQADLDRLLRHWQLDRGSLHQRTREIWAAGYRPVSQAAEAVGSGFDTSAEAAP
jgi:hypothetical protein